MPHLYLVDGSSFIFRAYHVLPKLTNKHGEPAGAVYGYVSMLWKLADELDKADGPTHLAVIFDKSEQTFRNEMYDQYKAHRPPAPEDLVPQFPMIRDATRAFSLPCIEEAGWEADDLIASYSKAALAQGWQVTIVSSDKDLMQLLTEPGIDMLDTMKDRRMGPEAVVEKFGVGPDKLGEVLALMGDSVDNVPGVPGIGPKTAAKLILEHGDVEAVLAAAPAMKPGKLRDNLIEHADKARLSRKLVELACDVPLPDPLESMELNGIPDAPLRAFLDHHGFKTLLARLGNAGTTVADAPVETPDVPGLEEDPPCNHDGYATVTDAAELDRWIADARHQGWVAFDTETTGVDATRAELVGVSLALKPNIACYVPIGHGGTDMFAEKPVQLDRDVALAKLKPLLEDPSVLKIGHNLKYDAIVLARCCPELGGITVGPYDDTIVMSFDLDAGLHGHGMDELAATHLSHSCIAYKDVTGSGKKQIGFHEVDLKAATRYAAEDADVTLRLWKRFKPRLAYEGATRVYEMVDRPLVRVIADMEREGIKIDAAVLSRLSDDFSKQIAALEEEIHAIAGFKFTIGSPKQLGDVLFDKMGIKGGRKGKSGVYSTDVNELERIAADKDSPGREMVLKVLDWRQLSKLKSTYTDALQAQINPATGRVHTSYSLTGAQTGRLSSTDPNLQNIPIRTETGRQIRDAFVAEPGNVILSADYSQIELRLAAHIADVPALREAFESGEDIHNRTAMELFGEVNRDTRGRAKTINFAILYGISRWGLAGRLDVTPDEAQGMIDRYFQSFPGISRYIADTLTEAKQAGYTTTLFGRKTHFPRLQSKTQHERAGSERAAINAPIQGTSADIIKRAMARMGPALAEAGLPNVKMLLQVHDELVFELPEGDVEAARPVIERVMATAAEPAITLTVPLGIEIGVGPSWGAAH
ncbi:DNA polymerase I [Sphingomonas turrisvirgatae]|uniref:DNA polymerase I n=1 Tax=Sphingomonas turrisvirgatae TaxID=1888892 RepID=A0A1E3LV01_9SPHN|nr:DNA polymerase I [Sphingomonas turrisvirgatae]ODP37578.1 DNA polymerase I [Sphingomonas turrisvirgatae]